MKMYKMTGSKPFGYSIVCFLWMLSVCIAIPLAAQDTGEDTPRKSARISLSYKNINNLGPRLIAEVKTRVDRAYVGAAGVLLHFYFQEVTEENELGTLKTDKDGKAVFIIPEKLRKPLDTLGRYVFFAAIENDDTFKDREKDIEITRSRVELELEEKDSTKWAHFFVGAADSTGCTLYPAGDYSFLGKVE